MDHPTSPSSSARPAKGQRRLSQQPMDHVYVKSIQPEADHSVIPPKTPVNPACFLTTQLMQILHSQADLAMPAFKLLCFYFCFWDCYVGNPPTRSIWIKNSRNSESPTSGLKSRMTFSYSAAMNKRYGCGAANACFVNFMPASLQS
ncbi:hypothetical protein N7451_012026 [Penicillium sp. IBT 35674x]|nr:hypothetical protein N7451_012026 [Penicillium sp. IBT 35674x]